MRGAGGESRHSTSSTDKLGKRLLGGRVDEGDLRRLDQFRQSFREAYEVVVTTLRSRLNVEPTGRPSKSTSSIREKLRRESMRLSQMQDIAGCRLLVADLAGQNQLVDRLTLLFPRCTVVDRRVTPSHGYRAVHVITWVGGRCVEIQVRTEIQNKWAEASELLSDRLDPAIKYGGGDERVARDLIDLSLAVQAAERLELASHSSDDPWVQLRFATSKGRVVSMLHDAVESWIRPRARST